MLFLLLTAVLAVSRNRFEDKVCLVTGATSGIGYHVTLALAQEGCKVVFTGRRQELGEKVQAEIEAAGGVALYVKADVTKEEDNKRMVDVAVEKFGRLDAAFNNAGVAGEWFAPLHELEFKDWKWVIDVNLNGVFLGMKYELQQFMKQGTGGSILNCNSIYGRTSIPMNGSPYIASKHGLTGLTKTGALTYAKHGIRINDLNPGFTDTAGMAADPLAGFEDVFGKLHPNGKFNSMKGVVNSALFALSDDAVDVSGMQFEVSHGVSAGFATSSFVDNTLMPEFSARMAELTAAAEAANSEEESCAEKESCGAKEDL